MKTSLLQKRHSLPQSGQSGFTMVEVLVAAVVLTVGLLAAASMQAKSMSANRDSSLTSKGVVYAKEMAEIMRGNKEVAIKTSSGDNPYLLSGATAPSASAPNCHTGPCTDSKVFASYQINEWLGRVATDLPGATVSICYDDSPYDAAGLPQWPCSNSGGVAVVKIGWDRRSTDSGATSNKAILHALTPAVVVPVIAGSAL